ncbi:MAG TPA: class I SAM-dependent methyltransferase [Pirellulales bacterium]
MQFASMWEQNQYELLDFGAGRKLERFGGVLLDRPAPAAAGASPADASLWKQVDARFELAPTPQAGAARGNWIVQREVPTPWTIDHGSFTCELKPTDFGHVGLFPEQAANWDWIAARIGDGNKQEPREHNASESSSVSSSEQIGEQIKVLNLFAYTGASTLAAAAAGASVTHVDSAKNVVAWARRNAALSNLATASVRWIAEDAVKFVRRELKRGQKYDALILDPPSYGHGPAGEVWKIELHLTELLSLCRELLAPQPRFVLLSAHAPDFDPPALTEHLIRAGYDHRPGEIEADEIFITARDGRRLQSGAMARILAHYR